MIYLRDKSALSKSFVRYSCLTLISASLISCYGPVGKTSLKEQDSEKEGGLYGLKGKNKGWLDSKSANANEIDKIDPAMGLSREDYNSVFRTKRNPALGGGAAPLQLPKLTSLIKKPKKPTLKNDKLVTLSVTDSVPLKDVFIELSRRADVDMEIDPGISGGVIFSAKEKPFTEVIERLTKLAKLRYSLEDGIFKVERDLPYVVNYGMNLLNSTRTFNSTIGTSESELGTSTTQVDIANANGDMWQIVEAGIANIILQYTKKREEEEAPDADEASAGGSSSSGGSGGSLGTQVNRIRGLIGINRQAGVVTVMATKRQHDEIKAYLDYIQMSATSQVLIEAKVVEVSLNDQYRSGIKWDFLNNNVTGTSITNNFAAGPVGNKLFEEGSDSFSVGILPSQLFGWNGTSIDASIELLEEFGVTRALSNPRLSAMNNQFAVLNFSESLTYFTVTVEQDSQSTGGTSTQTTFTIDSEENTIPIGMSLTIQPSIDLGRNEITMNVRPRLTREVKGEGVPDPAVDLNAALIATQTTDATLAGQIRSIQSVIPRISTRELDTVMRLTSGNIMVIGGLMEERSLNIDQGVPGVSKIPLLGNAFKSVQKNSEIVETVIFLKATIVPGKGVSVADKKFYQKFTRERDPVNFSN